MDLWISYHDSDGNGMDVTLKNVLSISTNYTSSKLIVEYYDDDDCDIERSFTIPFSKINRFFSL